MRDETHTEDDDELVSLLGEWQWFMGVVGAAGKSSGHGASFAMRATATLAFHAGATAVINAMVQAGSRGDTGEALLERLNADLQQLLIEAAAIKESARQHMQLSKVAGHG